MPLSPGRFVVFAKGTELTCTPLSSGRCVVFAKEPEEGQDAPEPTEEEAEQGPEPLSTVEKDVEVGGAEAWTPLFSSSNSSVKNQVNGAAVPRYGPAVAGHGAACLQL